MRFHILTLFPDMIMQGLNTSIIGRAMEKQLISISAVNIRNYTQDKHGKVDDYPYGGGAGMLMQTQPVYDAWQAVTGGRKVRTIYVTPQGRTFNQKLAMDLAKEEELVFLCGHYEGIDERVLEETVTDYISIGDYVLTGGELPAMVMIDAISRLVPGVLNNEASAETESFYNDLLEYPQYSRPKEWHGKAVPTILLSGNHTKIREWRLETAKERTRERRPDLYKRYCWKEKVIKRLSKEKRNNIHLMESLSRGKGEIVYAEGTNVLIYDGNSKACMLSVESQERGEALLKLIPEDVKLILSSQEFMNASICAAMNFQIVQEYYQVCYTQKEPLPVAHKDIRLLTTEELPYILAHYTAQDKACIQERILARALYGAYVEEKLVGFVGIHAEGSMGILFVEEGYRGRRIGKSLEAYVINLQREWGHIPYGHVAVGDGISVKLQESMGLYFAKNTLWRLEKVK